MIAAQRYMARWYMPPGVHDLHGVEPVRCAPPPTDGRRWLRSDDWAWERVMERTLNEAWEAAERERCAHLQTTPRP